MGSVAGRLLVAAPAIGDPNFDRSVVLMLEHSDDGALGLVINRPLDTDVAEMLPEWSALAAVPSVFFQGGPVALDGVIGLGRGPVEPAEGWTPILGDIGTVDLHRAPVDHEAAIKEVRLFAGHSGWGGGQLDAELSAQAWYVLDADPDDAFTPVPDDLWYTVVGRQPPPLGWLVNFPPDPSLN